VNILHLPWQATDEPMNGVRPFLIITFQLKLLPIEQIAPIANAAGKGDEHVALSASLPAATRIAPHDINFLPVFINKEVSS
jgi:hypothetical protein